MPLNINDSMLLVGIAVGVVTAIISTFLVKVKTKIDVSVMKEDEKKASREVEQTLQVLKAPQEKEISVIHLMMNNVAELKDFYVICKQQATRSFTSALATCFMGFALFSAGIVLHYVSSINSIVLFTTIAGTLVEIISGLFFRIYYRSLTQLNLYHERLGATEKYLTAIQLTERISEERRDDMMRYLIEVILIDNSTVTRKVGDNRAPAIIEKVGQH